MAQFTDLMIQNELLAKENRLFDSFLQRHAVPTTTTSYHVTMGMDEWREGRGEDEEGRHLVHGFRTRAVRAIRRFGGHFLCCVMM